LRFAIFLFISYPLSTCDELLNTHLLTYLLTYLLACISVEQVVHDGSKFRPVVGGYFSGKITKKGFFEQQLNLVGEYKFSACVSAYRSLLIFEQ